MAQRPVHHQVTCVFVPPDEALRKPRAVGVFHRKAHCQCSMRLQRARRHLTADQPACGRGKGIT